MSGPPDQAAEPKQYVVARIQDALARDPRVGELDIHAKIVGQDVFLNGSVPTEDRREAISVVVDELLPDHEVHNQIAVTNPTSETVTEELP
jgi:osmotically-inducible protein OsmY